MLSYSCMQKIHQSILDLINNYRYSSNFHHFKEDLYIRVNLEMIEIYDDFYVNTLSNSQTTQGKDVFKKELEERKCKKDYKMVFHSAKTEFKTIGSDSYARGAKQYGLLIKYRNVEEVIYEKDIKELINYINEDILKEIKKDNIKDYEKSKRDLFEEFY